MGSICLLSDGGLPSGTYLLLCHPLFVRSFVRLPSLTNFATMLVLSAFSYAFLVPPPAAHAQRRHSLREPARAAASVRMEAQTIMEMPMPKELADWGVPAHRPHPAHAHLFRALCRSFLSTLRLNLQAWTRSCGARSTETAERACWAVRLEALQA